MCWFCHSIGGWAQQLVVLLVVSVEEVARIGIFRGRVNRISTVLLRRTDLDLTQFVAPTFEKEAVSSRRDLL